ncbi:Glutaminase 2|nr:Glutaminase 2 [Candidatus Pantoea persica]
MQLELEHGKPRNPFIKAGALVVCDMLETRLTALRQLSGQPDIHYDRHVARSEYEHSARNAAIA